MSVATRTGIKIHGKRRKRVRRTVGRPKHGLNISQKHRVARVFVVGVAGRGGLRWRRGTNTNTNTNTKYTSDTGQTRNKLLEQWMHLTNHTAGHSRPSTARQTA